MAIGQGRSTTGRRRWAVAAIGAVVLVGSLAAQLAFAFLLSLCGLGESEPAPGSWCALSYGTQQTLVLVPMGLSVASYAWTVWKRRYAPVLIGGPLLTVFWIAVMFLTVLS
jgi:hypothetical protein